ncbi:MAG: ABC transporter ATP-binding protein [Clostridia bacterium]|jgi:putative ABC transport system ATP-binding protein|nr:ABC transporter ATP-binding protein [Clostridia bacterium]MBP6949410.1 ABC transporter ATP-binding protein [Clostridia bacterium]
MKLALETKGLAKTYLAGTPQEVQALKPTDLQFEVGKFYAVIGKSGSGKSTLLHLLGALDTPTAGEVWIGDENVYELNDRDRARLRRRRIGFVFQAYNLLMEHSVRENITLPVDLDGRDLDEEYFDKIVDSLDIRDQLHKYPMQLSGGEQQRVAIARALISRPNIVLADEPTGNLDTKNGEIVLELLISTAKAFNQTVILVTHDLDIASRAERLIVIDNGFVSAEHQS